MLVFFQALTMEIQRGAMYAVHKRKSQLLV
jgi:hypothetical protein